MALFNLDNLKKNTPWGQKTEVRRGREVKLRTFALPIELVERIEKSRAKGRYRTVQALVVEALEKYCDKILDDKEEQVAQNEE